MGPGLLSGRRLPLQTAPQEGGDGNAWLSDGDRRSWAGPSLNGNWAGPRVDLLLLLYPSIGIWAGVRVDSLATDFSTFGADSSGSLLGWAQR